MDTPGEIDMTAIGANIGARIAEVREGIVRKAIADWSAMSPEARAESAMAAEEREARRAALTPQEKWARLTNPTCADDYGLSMTLEEVRAVPDAKSEVEAWISTSAQRPNVELTRLP